MPATLAVTLLVAAVALLLAGAAAVVLLGTRRRRGCAGQPRHACVLVLGDVGRSPRMCYHALSLAAHGFHVSLVGYRGARPPDAVAQHPRIALRYVPEPLRWAVPRSRALFVLLAPVKVAVQLACVVWTLGVRTPRPDCLLVQNPPSIPTLALAQGVAWLHGAVLVIDWHNFGYSLLAMRVGGEKHWLARLARMYETAFGRRAFAHLAVTRAMADVLAAEPWRLSSRPVVLHDRPPAHFRRLRPDETHAFLVRVQQPELGLDQPTEHETLLTRAGGAAGEVRMRTDRAALLVSGTSWTADEDFGVLVAALERYAREAERQPERGLARLVVVVTGRGPLRKHYERQFARLEGPHVRVRTAWLCAEDYPRLLGAADLGVSLHTSSSGLDLPMKVVDMFGCGLPVCAFRFACIDELVRHEDNGLVFASADELADQLVRLFSHWAPPAQPSDEGEKPLQRLAAGAARFQATSWEANWDAHALPVFAAVS